MEEHKIVFTYLNIRQSIAILLAKIILIDILILFLLIGAFWALTLEKVYLNLYLVNPGFFLVFFILLGLFKLLLSTYIVLQWLNEYYEITPEYIYHKKGIIFRKNEQYRIDVIRRMDVQDTFLGELLNFATITLYDIRLNKYLDLFLIHNPRRYAHILKQLRPEIEAETDRVRLPFMPKEESID